MVKHGMEQQQQNIEITGSSRDKQGRFKPGISGNIEGRKPETPEEKILKKATKELIQDYKDKLAEALPKISPILIGESLKGNINAIKELHDRVMGKPPQDVNLGSNPELPYIIKIVKDDGDKGKDSQVIQHTV